MYFENFNFECPKTWNLELDQSGSELQNYMEFFNLIFTLRLASS